MEDLNISKFDVFFDIGSGTTTERDDFKSLCESIRNKKYEMVIVTEMSRISRDSKHFSEFLELLMENDVQLNIVDSSLGSNKDEITLNMKRLKVWWSV